MQLNSGDGQAPHLTAVAAKAFAKPVVLRLPGRHWWQGHSWSVGLMVLAGWSFGQGEAAGVLRWAAYYPLAALAVLGALLNSALALTARRGRIVLDSFGVEVIEGSGVTRRHAWASIAQIAIEERHMNLKYDTPRRKLVGRRLILSGKNGETLEEFDEPLEPGHRYDAFLTLVPELIGAPVRHVSIDA